MFDDTAKNLLLKPENWTFVSSFIINEAKEISESKVPLIEAKRINFHSHREILIPLKGEYSYYFNNKYYRCDYGSIFLIDSGDEHELMYTNEASGLSHLWLVLLKDKVLARILKINNGHITFGGRVQVKFIDIIPDININLAWDKIKRTPDGWKDELCIRKFILALSWLFIKIIENSKFANKNDDYQKEIIDATMKHIQKNIRNNISTSQLARFAGYSRFHFLRLFKQYSQLTVKEYINICRKQRFKELSKKGISRKEIAFELGFSCTASFYNWLSNNKKHS